MPSKQSGATRAVARPMNLPKPEELELNDQLRYVLTAVREYDRESVERFALRVFEVHGSTPESPIQQMAESRLRADLENMVLDLFRTNTDGLRDLRGDIRKSDLQYLRDKWR